MVKKVEAQGTHIWKTIGDSARDLYSLFRDMMAVELEWYATVGLRRLLMMTIALYAFQLLYWSQT